uniref:Uncharacterized protein n=1 Tax=Anguilla anguilla TaxID=7936 RepID=A0A0E9TIA0_ANGAN
MAEHRVNWLLLLEQCSVMCWRCQLRFYELQKFPCVSQAEWMHQLHYLLSQYILRF